LRFYKFGEGSVKTFQQVDSVANNIDQTKRLLFFIFLITSILMILSIVFVKIQ